MGIGEAVNRRARSNDDVIEFGGVVAGTVIVVHLSPPRAHRSESNEIVSQEPGRYLDASLRMHPKGYRGCCDRSIRIAARLCYFAQPEVDKTRRPVAI